MKNMFIPSRLIFKGPEVTFDAVPNIPKLSDSNSQPNPASEKVDGAYASDNGEDMGQCTKGSCEFQPSTDYEKAIKDGRYRKVESADVDKIMPGSIVVVSAEWCPKCPGVLRAVADKNPGKNLVVVNYDSDDSGLDAKFGHEGGVPKIAVATDRIMTNAQTGKQEKVYEDVTKLYTGKNV